MSKLIFELGADTSDFKLKVDDLPTVVSGAFKKTRQVTETEGGGIVESVEGLKGSFRQLKEFFLVGGLVEGVKKFYDLAIDQANKSTDANDMNAAAVRRFGETLGTVKEGVANAAVVILGSINRFGEGFVDAGKEALKFWFNVGEGAGELEQSEIATRKVVAAWEDAKKHAAEWNQLNAESKKITEQIADIERGKLPLHEQQAVLLVKQNELLAQAAAVSDNHLESRKLLNQAAEAGLELAKVQKDLDAENAKQVVARRAEQEKITEAELAALTPIERQKALKQDIIDLQGVLKSNLLSQAETEVFTAELGQRKLDLVKTQAEVEKDRVKIAKESSLGEEEVLRIMELQSASKRGLTEAEQNELALLKLQSAEKKLHIELSDLLQKKITETITPAESKRLDELVKQEKNLQTQIADKAALVKAAASHQLAEAGVTSEFSKQLALINQMNPSFDANKPGGEGTTTITDLQTKADQAANALQYAYAHLNNLKPGEFELAQATNQRAQENLSLGKSASQRPGSTYGDVPLNALNNAPITAQNTSGQQVSAPAQYQVSASVLAGRKAALGPITDTTGSLLVTDKNTEAALKTANDTLSVIQDLYGGLGDAGLFGGG